ncbi:uncharacterized protein LOC121384449 [Gigantopelta aegis]|uniref:uncharacterized protein LOC121384449 n=1 Tax=Gigantopelta aegis TaxID=1735272 RepID=UPI001B88E512|nr:uncharacterized protein LOC121384449 [Gigantopelta aegis]XP_041370782.1 uncharacterized protein LOC121384449 [Gigantopelta aegis]XP_041370783.1 uncharacterized protein LOC121384449 [Gigantopelta aegis]
MIKFSSQSLPSIDFRKGESIVIYPSSKHPPTLDELRVSGVSTFWRSPYKNEIYTGITFNSHPGTNHRYITPKPLGQVKGILKNKSISKDSESDSSGDEIKKLRGILTKKMAEGALRKKSSKRVQFDDRLVRLHEIGRRHGYTSSGESVTSDDIDDFQPTVRHVALKDSKETGSYNDRVMPHVPKAQRLCHEELISSEVKLSGNLAANRCSSAPVLNNEKSSSKSLNNLEQWMKSPDNRQFQAESRLSQDSIVFVDADRQTVTDRQTAPDRPVPARPARSFTSPVLLSQRSTRKPLFHYQSSSRHDSTTSSSDTALKKHLVHSARSYPQSRVVPQAAGAQHFEIQEIRHRNSNYCNHDKTNQIIRWLKDVNITQAREGRCTVLLPGMNEHRDM